MPKKKQFLQPTSKQAARGKKKEPEPETEDDFLDAADEFEKSAGKWRAGDAAKSARFFQRAIDAYAAGLQKFPKSFDLAYNKALLEYQITQDLRIAAQLGHPIVNLLRQALDSHRFAMTLNDNNLDIQFNTANVLSDLADRVIHSKEEAIPLLQEAVGLIRRCLERQVQEYESLQAAFLAANSGDASADDALPSSTAQNDSSSGSSSEEYATVEEAITESTILDSVFLLAHVLADLLEIYPPERVEAIRKEVETTVGLFTSGALQPYFDKLDKTVLEPEPPSLSLSLSLSAAPPKPSRPQPSEQASALAEGALAAARLFSAVAEIEFRRGERSAASWYAAVLTKFSATDPSLDPNTHGALVDALTAVAAATAATATAAGEAAYLAQAPSVPLDGGGGGGDDGAAVPPSAVAPEEVGEAWTPDAVHADVLRRAYHVLAAALAAGGVPSDKAPQLYVALGDVHWRLRGASVGAGPLDVAGAVAQARRAERCWKEAARKARAVGVACAEEEVEAEGKGRVSALLRGAAGGGVVVGEARESVLHAVEEMREDELLHDVLAERVLSMLGSA